MTQHTQRTFARANLLRTCRLCCGLVSNTMGKSPTCYGLATGKWILCNGFGLNTTSAVSFGCGYL